MPWSHVGVRRRLKLLGMLWVVGGLMAATTLAASAQQQQPPSLETQFQPHGTGVSAEFSPDLGLDLNIPSQFFPGFESEGVSAFLLPQSLRIDDIVTQDGSVTVQSVQLSDDQAQPELIAPNPDRPQGSAVEYLGRAVSVTVSVLDFNLNDSARFNPPMTLSFDLTLAEWEKALNDPNAFVVRSWDPSGGMWLATDTQTDPFERVVSANITRPGHFALFLETPPPAVQGGDVALGSMTLLAIAMAGLTLIVAGGTVVRGAREKRAV